MVEGTPTESIDQVTPRTLSLARRALLDTLADICPIRPAGSAWAVLIGVDGVDGAGKSTLAEELGSVLATRGRAVLRVGEDDFHAPRRVRYARGRHSPDGFFLDSYDDARLVADVLAPLGPDGDGRVRRAAFDVVRDEPVDAPVEQVPRGAVLVLDGLFLHRNALAGAFDVSVWLRVPFDETFARMASRDGCSPDPAAPENARYVGGQRRYLRECHPAARATVVVDNTDVDAPFVVPDQARGA